MSDRKSTEILVESAIDKMGVVDRIGFRIIDKFFIKKIGIHPTTEQIIESAASGVTSREASETAEKAKKMKREAEQSVEKAKNEAEEIVRRAQEEVRRAQEEARRAQEEAEILKGRVEELRREEAVLKGIVKKASQIEYAGISEGNGTPPTPELSKENEEESLRVQAKKGESLEYADRMIPLIRGTAVDVEALVQRERTEIGLFSGKVNMVQEGKKRMMRLLGIAKAYYDSHITDSRVEIKMPNGTSLSEFIISRLSEAGPKEHFSYRDEDLEKYLEEFVKGYVSTLPESEQKKADIRGTVLKIKKSNVPFTSMPELLATPSIENPIKKLGSSSEHVEIPKKLNPSEDVLQAILDSDDEIFRLYNPERITRHEAIKKREKAEREKSEK